MTRQPSRAVFFLRAKISSRNFSAAVWRAFSSGRSPRMSFSPASSRMNFTNCPSRAAESEQRWRMTAHVLTRASSNHGSALLSKIACIRKLLKTHSCKAKPYSTSSQLDDTRKPNQPPSSKNRVAAGQK